MGPNTSSTQPHGARGERLPDRAASADLLDGLEQDRDRLIERRRVAQRDWRSARQRVDRATQNLAEALRGPSSRVVSTVRNRLVVARDEEHAARSAYKSVAEETGRLLGRLQRLVADRRS